MWNASSDASLYHVQISSVSNFSTLLFSVYVSEANYTPASDLPEGKIYWRVSAKDLAGNEGLYSTSDDFTIDITPPGAVNVTTAKGAMESITINWDTFNDVAGDFHSFNIYRSDSAITNVTELTPMNQSIVDNMVTSYVDTTGVFGKTYYYAVTAVDTTGNEYKPVTPLGPVMMFQTLGVSIDRTDWQLLNKDAGSEHISDSSSKVMVTNSGDGPQNYNLKITNQGNWTSSSNKNGAGIDTFVLSALFGADGDTGIDTTYFNEVASDDVVLSDSADVATSARFGSSRLSQSGVSVSSGGTRSLWFDLKAPLKDTTKGATHSIEVAINAEAS
jgi:hypothetical protein